MRSRRLIGACAALLTAACGSSSGNGLFSSDPGTRQKDASTEPTPNGGDGSATGGTAEANGGESAYGTGGTSLGGASGRGGTEDGGAAGAAQTGGAGSGPVGGGAGLPVGGAGGRPTGGAAGQGAGGKEPPSSGGAAGATPHSVACGAMPCQVGSSLASACCVSDFVLATVCIPTLGTGCANGGTAVTCDDVTDCTPGELCCADSAGNMPVTVCARFCKDGNDQICRTDAECRNGGSCVPIDRRPDYSSCK